MQLIEIASLLVIHYFVNPFPGRFPDLIAPQFLPFDRVPASIYNRIIL
jgi:hypothetical protein